MTALRRFLARPEGPIAVGVLLLAAVLTVVDREHFLTSFTIDNITTLTAFLGLVAIGETIVILAKEIDLSVGAVYGFTGIAFVSLTSVFVAPLAALVALLLAAVIGLLNAFLVIRMGLSSLIVTLGGLFLFRGLIYATTGGSVRSMHPEGIQNGFVRFLGGDWLFGLENSFWLMLAMAACFTYVLYRTRFGNQLYAVGGDSPSAASRGVSAARIKTKAFLISSLMAGFAGIVTLSSNPRTNVAMGENFELEVVAAAVVGGVLLSGGRGSALGAVLGALFFTTLRSELITIGVPPDYYLAFVGFILVIAAGVNSTIRQRLTLRTS